MTRESLLIVAAPFDCPTHVSKGVPAICPGGLLAPSTGTVQDGNDAMMLGATMLERSAVHVKAMTFARPSLSLGGPIVLERGYSMT
jgi:hypothetical protein